MRFSILFLAVILNFSIIDCLSGQFNVDPEIGIVEKLDTYLPDSIFVVNEKNDTSNLLDIINKPTIISLVYYRCPGICSPLMSGLADVIDGTDLTLDTDYQVLTISFDPREGTELAINKKKNYLNLMSNLDATEGWYYFTSDSASIKKLTEALGFKYKKQGNDFLHAGAIMAISPDGKITRYLNGTSFLPFEFKMALIEAAEGKTGPTINRVLQYCFNYDVTGQKYVVNITRIAAIFIMLLAITLFLLLVLKPIIKKRFVKST
jgi:protein SCO1/2